MGKSIERKVPFGLAIIPLLVMVVSMAVTIVKFEGDPHIPLIIGTVVAGLVAWFAGFKWNFIEEGIYKGIKMALPAILIIITVGMIIGSWIGGGVVATMVYYGLKIMSPSMFLVSISIITALITLAIGSSWSTMGTIGVAGMGIGMSMGIPAPMVAGAIISGSYFGDKMSPLSDTTNLAAGVTGTDLFAHIRHMVYTTVPAFLIALGVYWYLGRDFSNAGVDNQQILEIMNVIQSNFVISPWLLLVPAAVILLVAFKIPALPALIVGVFLGWITQFTVQGGAIADAVNTLQNGFTIETGNASVDELFSRGGIQDMMYTVSLALIAMAFAGVMEQTGMLQSIVEKILKLARTARSLVVSTVATSFLTNVAAGEQYLSVLLPGRMYKKAYDDKGLHSKNLSRAVEDGGTVTSPLVPWNTCAVFIISALSVHPFEYAPYAVLNFTVPILSIIFALFAFKLEFVKKESSATEAVRKAS
ncbi:Na+/H+ antiporter NhaC [Mesobacillus selenatarsenatis SF-1]|uniref:Na+/H+ antiporter NhaC n=1 Tax=Mesobacillus selenatarsenatis (strain DSM 18680 / JCM 14380 / FERM P-15431 / SF-1) TaxID=1321606 RepID=A0A0A8X2Y8_MESS1|nr:Na+/H+ antiporter NhaC [Mesobacillus selenatarsenatis SF-1]